MSTKEELLALAGRVEVASGADRGLDAAICVALGTEPQAREMLQFPAYDNCVRYYTASLDAAMSLVPEGWLVRLEGPFPAGWEAAVRQPYDDGEEVEAVTPALALTAAALRALAESRS